MSTRAGVLGIALLLILGSGPARAGAAERNASPEDRVLETLPLDGLSSGERERVTDAVRKLFRIHRAAGDPGGGEAEAYQEGVEALARFLKRETIEERRHVMQEAGAAMQMVDREWIDQAYGMVREGDFTANDESESRLEEQLAALRRVGDILKGEQAIVVRQKSLASNAERRFRELLRLQREARRLFESLGGAALRGALQWMIDDIDHALEESVRPAHDRQVRLLDLYRRAASDPAQTPDASTVRDFREYAAKARAIARELRGRD